MEALINISLCASLQMHNALHGFRSRRVMVTAIVELKLTQELVSMDQYTIFLVFLDFSKAYATVDQDRLLLTLEGYGAGPWLCGILETF